MEMINGAGLSETLDQKLTRSAWDLELCFVLFCFVFPLK